EVLTRRSAVLLKLERLSVDPTAMEVHENSNCRRCRADWDKTGPVCRHCKLEEDIESWESCVVYYRRQQKGELYGAGASSGLSRWVLAPFGPIREPDSSQDAGPGVNNAYKGRSYK
ncbi:unnamed protein product, partial [Choristocarpus tenellus]